MRVLLSRILLLALPLLTALSAHAGDAADFVAASSSNQARLLEAWAADPKAERVALLKALQENRLAGDDRDVPFYENGKTFVAAARCG